jgi:hypothetical protein
MAKRKRSNKIVVAVIGGVAAVLVALIGAWLPQGDNPLVSALLLLLLALCGLLFLLFGLILALRGDSYGSLIERLWTSQLTGPIAFSCGAFVIASSSIIMLAPGRSENVVIDCPAPEGIEDIFRKKMRSLDTEFYRIEPFPENELVSGSPGYYYVVDLKSAFKKEVWRFKLEEYTVNVFDRDFGRSVAAFVRDIIEPIESVAKYRLFVRGSADRDAGNDFRGNFAPKHRYSSVIYLQYSEGEGNYGPIPKVRAIAEPFTNEDLPFLRAEFMQNKLGSKVYGLQEEPAILEGVVNRAEENESLRNATVFLFVDWEAKGSRPGGASR